MNPAPQLGYGMNQWNYGFGQNQYYPMGYNNYPMGYGNFLSGYYFPPTYYGFGGGPQYIRRHIYIEPPKPEVEPRQRQQQ